MNLKRFAIRGIVFLAVFVALCMFFSGTVRTITTPKVRMTTPKRGKLEERLELNFRPAYPDVEKIEVALEPDTSLSIVKVNTREGYTVEEGEVVVEAKVANYDTQYKTFQDAYDAASEQLMALESKNRGIRINQRDQAYADAYFSLRDARREAVALELQMDAQLNREGLSRTESGYPEGASDALKKLIDDWRKAAKAQAKAQAAMDAASRYNVDENVWSYITEQREQIQKRDEAEQSLRKLVALNDRVSKITAPHDGYIASIELKEGDSYDGSQPLYTITAEDKMPTLRADLSEVTKSVSEGMTVTFNPDSYDSIDTKVTAVGTDSEGKKYVDVALNKELIRARGSVFAMTQEDTPMSLIFRAREATTLLPTSAVRGSGNDRYVYVTEDSNSALGGSTKKLHKVNVKVVGEYGGTSSVQEDLSYYTVVYGEDRSVSEGDAVMEYLN